MVFSGYMPSSGIAGLYGSSIFVFSSELLGGRGVPEGGEIEGRRERGLFQALLL